MINLQGDYLILIHLVSHALVYPLYKLYEGQEVTKKIFKYRAIPLVVSVSFDAYQILKYADLIFLVVSNYTVAWYLPLSRDLLNSDTIKYITYVSSKRKGPSSDIVDNFIYLLSLHSLEPFILVTVTIPSSLVQKVSKLFLLIVMINLRFSQEFAGSLLIKLRKWQRSNWKCTNILSSFHVTKCLFLSKSKVR